MPEFSLRYRNLWLSVGWGLVILIIYLSLTTHPPQPSVELPFGDKIGHALAYFTLMSWFAQIYPTSQHRILIAISCILLGGSLEILQGIGGIRVADWWDFLANSTGVLLGWGIVRLSSLGMLLFLLEQRWFYSATR